MAAAPQRGLRGRTGRDGGRSPDSHHVTGRAGAPARDRGEAGDWLPGGWAVPGGQTTKPRVLRASPFLTARLCRLLHWLRPQPLSHTCCDWLRALGAGFPGGDSAGSSLVGSVLALGASPGRVHVVSAGEAGELEQLLGPEYPHVVFSRLASDEAPDCPQGPGLVRQFGRLFAVEAQSGLKDYAMFYVGAEGLALTNFMLSWNRCPFSSFNPATGHGRRESLDGNRALLRRLYLVERARDARVVGILVGTLGVAGYLSILEHLRGILSRAGKRSYTLAMGKLSPAKLANFLEVDVFVLVACPQNSLLDSRDFYRPVVTPYELELACNPAREWSNLYVTDFRDLLPGGCAHVGFPDTVPGEGDVPDVSLITGELRAAGLSSSPAPSSSSALACRNPALALAEISPAASFLESRSWRGLEQQLGQTPVTKAVPGRRGIAIAYEDEACG
ncbi:LOW QUALITY PROTEIN: 2-(3-amino-3-carboxypropyl)histidine synthase subunit 2 [Lepidochelys kempii]|uniref:LOW QUALITY PROTEIN: 2-(3-amino-3-carboxypropyl)histidine synthase subunit 2 n=1 Tax=Lepidochelys kempii TaxID=8472 RepID=UPI003C6F4FAD